MKPPTLAWTHTTSVKKPAALAWNHTHHCQEASKRGLCLPVSFLATPEAAIFLPHSRLLPHPAVGNLPHHTTITYHNGVTTELFCRGLCQLTRTLWYYNTDLIHSEHFYHHQANRNITVRISDVKLNIKTDNPVQFSPRNSKRERGKNSLNTF